MYNAYIYQYLVHPMAHIESRLRNHKMYDACAKVNKIITRVMKIKPKNKLQRATRS